MMMRSKKISKIEYKQDLLDLISTVSKLKPIQIERMKELIATSTEDGHIDQTLWGYQWQVASSDMNTPPTQ